MLLNFSDRTRTGAFNMVWSYTFNLLVLVSLTVILSKNLTILHGIVFAATVRGGGRDQLSMRGPSYGPQEKAKVQGIAARLCILIHTS